MSDPRRALVVAEARTWIRTPYAHMQRCKGVGVDCLTFLAEVYERAGVVPHIEIPFYPPDWNLHRDNELYLDSVLRYAVEGKDPPQPGDIALFKFGRCYAHGVIVTEWPSFIHAWVGISVLTGDANGPIVRGRLVRFFNPFGD